MKISKSMCLFIICSGLVILAACSQNNTGSDPFAGMTLATVSDDNHLAHETPVTSSTLVPTTEPYQMGSVKEDFSSEDGLWYLEDDDYGKAAFVDGAFVVEARQKNQTMWSTYYGTFTDSVIDVDAQTLNSDVTQNNGFGIDCRIQDNGDGYSFHISSDGFFAILKFENTDSTRLVDWTQSDAINPDGESNHLTARCQGSQLEFWVNNVLVSTVEDTTFTSGAISLSVTTYADDPAIVSFDNLSIINAE